MLLRRGYNDVEVDAIMRSTMTRWATDHARNGRPTSRDLARLLDSGMGGPERLRDYIDAVVLNINFPDFEVHEHSFVSGPRVGGHYEADGKWHTGSFAHSHEGGSEPHAHPQTGPASYTIDKDEWHRATGIPVGGGRRQYTRTPTGEQMPWVELEDWQKHFEVIIAGDPKPELGEGPGIALPERIAQTFRMSYTVRDERSR